MNVKCCLCGNVSVEAPLMRTQCSSKNNNNHNHNHKQLVNNSSHDKMKTEQNKYISNSFNSISLVIAKHSILINDLEKTNFIPNDKNKFIIQCTKCKEAFQIFYGPKHIFMSKISPIFCDENINQKLIECSQKKEHYSDRLEDNTDSFHSNLNFIEKKNLHSDLKNNNCWDDCHSTSKSYQKLCQLQKNILQCLKIPQQILIQIARQKENDMNNHDDKQKEQIWIDDPDFDFMFSAETTKAYNLILNLD